MQKTYKASELEVGQALPDLDFETTATIVAGGALASRDYTPVHHDKAAAVSQAERRREKAKQRARYERWSEDAVRAHARLALARLLPQSFHMVQCPRRLT